MPVGSSPIGGEIGANGLGPHGEEGLSASTVRKKGRRSAFILKPRDPNILGGTFPLYHL